MTLITKEQLKKVATNITNERADKMAGLLNAICPKYGIDTVDEFHEFAANVIQESGEFEHKAENMNYSAKRLTQVWPSRFPNILAASPYARNPQKLANKVYGGRMGNKKENDGWIFRGGGFIGLTGRDVYQKYADFIKKDVAETAALVRNDDFFALDSAAWFFSTLKGLNDEAERDEMIGIIKSINGGLIGKDARLMYYERLKKYV